MASLIDEKRRDRRLEEFHDLTLSVISDRKHPGEKIYYNYIEDISESGARIHVNSFLSVETPLRMDIKLENMQQMITIKGKVIWSKFNYDDGSCDAGVEFTDIPPVKLEDYIAWANMCSSP